MVNEFNRKQFSIDIQENAENKIVLLKYNCFMYNFSSTCCGLGILYP